MKREHYVRTGLCGAIFILVLSMMSFYTPVVTPSFAADAVPDLKGTWQGKSQTVAVGKLGHTTQANKPAFISVEFTLQIDQQQGAVFHGTKRSKKSSEQVVGVVKADNRTIHLADHDGYYQGTLLSPDEMELVYLEAGTKSRVASITIYKRVK